MSIPVESGAYKIINVATGAFIIVDPATGEVKGYNPNDLNISIVKWHVVNSNGQYAIQPYSQPDRYATATSNAGDSVKVGERFQWAIKETSPSGQYLIYVADNDTLYWDLESPTATVKLTSNSGLNAQWKFQPFV